MSEKTCIKCGATWPETIKYFNVKYKGRFANTCRACDREAGRALYQKQKGALTEKRKAKKDPLPPPEAISRTRTDRGTTLVTFGDAYKAPRREPRGEAMMGYMSPLASIR